MAGTGGYGYNGDNIAATTADLTAPNGVAVDGSGNIYIADEANQRIRKVTPGGTITTVAGNGTMSYNGDNIAAIGAELANPEGVAVDGAGNLYIADVSNSRIRKVTPGGTITTVAGTGANGYNGDNIAATSAELSYPTGVAVDGAGNLRGALLWWPIAFILLPPIIPAWFVERIHFLACELNETVVSGLPHENGWISAQHSDERWNHCLFV